MRAGEREASAACAPPAGVRKMRDMFMRVREAMWQDMRAAAESVP